MRAEVSLHTPGIVEARLIPGAIGRFFGQRERTIYLVARRDELGWIHWFTTAGEELSSGHPAVQAIAEKPWKMEFKERR